MGLTLTKTSSNYDPDKYIKRTPGEKTYMKHLDDIYWRGEKMNGVNPDTFVELGDGYAKDKFLIFYNGHSIGQAKILKKFMNMKNGYAKDSKNVYYNGEQIKADPRTIRVIGDGKALDKDRVYLYGKSTTRSRKRY